MAKYKIAHLREQGQDMIIVPLDGQFHYKTNSEQNDFISSLQAYARSAGLAGTVVPVWQHSGSMYFIAPRPWQLFFKSLSWNVVLANINKELTCN